MAQRRSLSRSRPSSRVDSRRPVRHAVRVEGRDVKRLAEAVRSARGEMGGLSQREFAERAGLSEITVQRIEAAKIEPRSKTLAGLDRAIPGWESGTARAILLGGEPPLKKDSHRTDVRYHDRDTGEIDEKAILQRMIELVPSIRKRYGNEQADIMVGRIMTLAVESNLVDFVSAHLQEYAAQ